jgi:hypothetical protein
MSAHARAYVPLTENNDAGDAHDETFSCIATNERKSDDDDFFFFFRVSQLINESLTTMISSVCVRVVKRDVAAVLPSVCLHLLRDKKMKNKNK